MRGTKTIANLDHSPLGGATGRFGRREEEGGRDDELSVNTESEMQFFDDLDHEEKKRSNKDDEDADNKE